MTSMRWLPLTGPILLVLSVLLAGCAKEELEGGTPLYPYPLDRCLVCDKKLATDSESVAEVFVYDGKEIKVCGEDCRNAFNRNRQLYLAKLPPPIPEEPPQP